MQPQVIYTKIAFPSLKHSKKNPEYPDEYPEYLDPQVRSFRAYTWSFPRSIPNPEYPGLYPEFRPECSKPGVFGLIPGVSPGVFQNPEYPGLYPESPDTTAFSPQKLKS